MKFRIYDQLVVSYALLLNLLNVAASTPISNETTFNTETISTFLESFGESPPTIFVTRGTVVAEKCCDTATAYETRSLYTTLTNSVITTKISTLYERVYNEQSTVTIYTPITACVTSCGVPLTSIGIQRITVALLTASTHTFTVLKASSNAEILTPTVTETSTYIIRCDVVTVGIPPLGHPGSFHDPSKYTTTVWTTTTQNILLALEKRTKTYTTLITESKGCPLSTYTVSGDLTTVDIQKVTVTMLMTAVATNSRPTLNPQSSAFAIPLPSSTVPALMSSPQQAQLSSSSSATRPNIMPTSHSPVRTPGEYPHANNRFKIVPDEGIVINGRKLMQGETLIDSGTTYALPAGATAPIIISNGVPIVTLSVFKAFQLSPTPTTTPLVSPSGIAINGATLISGESIVIHGTTYSLPLRETSPAILPISNGLPILTLPGLKASQTNADPTNSALSPLSGVVVDGKTLTLGRMVVISGTTVSLPAGATFPIIISNGTPILTLSGLEQSLLSPPSTTFMPQVPGYLIDGVALSPGSTIMVSGTTYSLPPGATALVIISDGKPKSKVSGLGSTLLSNSTGAFKQASGVEANRLSSARWITGLLTFCELLFF